jgi:two-component system response regulator
MLSYDMGVNAFVVKPIDCEQFHEALKTLGVFWAIVNEPKPIKTT